MPWYSPKTWFQNERLKSADLNTYIRDNMLDLDARVTAAAAAASPTGFIGYTAAAAAPTGWLLCDGAAVSRTTYANLFAAIGTAFGAGDGSATFNLPNLKGRVIVGLDSGQTEFDTRGETGGEKTVTLALANMPTHSHTVNSHSHGGVTGWKNISHWHDLGGHVHGTSSAGLHRHPLGGDYGSRFAISHGAAANALLPFQAGGERATFSAMDEVGGHDHGNTGGPTTNSGWTDPAHDHGIAAEAPGTNSQGGGTAHNNLQPYLVLNAIVKT